jgi:hypothetical protein
MVVFFLCRSALHTHTHILCSREREGKKEYDGLHENASIIIHALRTSLQRLSLASISERETQARASDTERQRDVQARTRKR